MKFILLEEVDSTNSYCALHSDTLDNMTMVAAHRQTQGRGQRGNSWESEEGANLTFTLLFRPEGLKATAQFAVSEATALASLDFLKSCSIEAQVKWPNDIYVADRKIAGILIENSVMGAFIHHCRIGMGLNVNQTIFRSDAPNPVSMAQITGRTFDISHAAAALGAALERRLPMALSPEGRRLIHEEFLANLWRGDGMPHPFRIRGEQSSFQGVIEDVAPTGPISIRDIDSGISRQFAFKEVEFLLG